MQNADAEKPRRLNFKRRKRVRGLGEALSIAETSSVPAARNPLVTDAVLEAIERRAVVAARVESDLRDQLARALASDEEPQGARRAKRPTVTLQTPLDRYLKRKQITPRQFEAGERLARLFHRAQWERRVVSVLDGMPPGIGGDPFAVTDAAIAARETWAKWAAKLGQRLTPVLIDVCCLGGSAADWAIARGYSRPKDGLVILRLALDALGDILRLDTREP